MIIAEMSRRIADLAYWNAQQKMGKLLKDLGGINSILNGSSGDELKFTFVYKFIAGDIQQIVARERRKGLDG